MAGGSNRTSTGGMKPFGPAPGADHLARLAIDGESLSSHDPVAEAWIDGVQAIPGNAETRGGPRFRLRYRDRVGSIMVEGHRTEGSARRCHLRPSIESPIDPARLLKMADQLLGTLPNWPDHPTFGVAPSEIALWLDDVALDYTHSSMAGIAMIHATGRPSVIASDYIETVQLDRSLPRWKALSGTASHFLPWPHFPEPRPFEHRKWLRHHQERNALIRGDGKAGSWFVGYPPRTSGHQKRGRPVWDYHDEDVLVRLPEMIALSPLGKTLVEPRRGDHGTVTVLAPELWLRLRHAKLARVGLEDRVDFEHLPLGGALMRLAGTLHGADSAARQRDAWAREAGQD